MIKYKTELQKIKVFEECICDKCEKTLDEFSDFVEFKHNFGYGSERDGDSISFEICDNCLMEMLDEFGVKYKYEKSPDPEYDGMV